MVGAVPLQLLHAGLSRQVEADLVALGLGQGGHALLDGLSRVLELDHSEAALLSRLLAGHGGNLRHNIAL